MARGNRSIENNPTGQSNTPRLKGNSSTTNVGKGGGKSGGRYDTQDSNAFKRGDSKGGKASNFLTDSSKAHRSSGKMAKMPDEMPNKFSRGE